MRHANESQLAVLQLVRDHGNDAPYRIAQAYAWRGQPDEAFHWLDRAVVQRDGTLRDVSWNVPGWESADAERAQRYYADLKGLSAAKARVKIVEQLREYQTQLSTPMYYGNFFVGKLLELKHLGQGTFTDVGTTYKVIRRETLVSLLRHLDPAVNLEFNAHFLDRALTERIPIVECPITFHARVGASKGGNVNKRRAARVGFRMIIGLSFGWRWLR
jgi:hypothetical protein